MNTNCQTAKAYMPQWIIVMDWMMSWLRKAMIFFIFSILLRQISSLYLQLSLMMSCLLFYKPCDTA